MSTKGDFNLRHPAYKTGVLVSELLVHRHSRTLFSAHPAAGIRNRKSEKYRTDAIWPIIIKGCSTGIPPIQVRIATSAIRTQNKNWVKGRKVRARCLEVWRIGTNIRIKIEASSARTPPSLFGIDRRIA